MRIEPTAPDDEHVRYYLQCRRERDQAQADLDDAQEMLLKQMEHEQRKSYRWRADGHSFSLTYVAKNTTVIDEPALRKALTAKVFDKYTKRVLDRKAMEEAITDGVVDPVTVSAFVELKPQKPYLDYRNKATTKEDE